MNFTSDSKKMEASSILLLLALLSLSLLFLLRSRTRGPLRLPVIGHLHLLQTPLHHSLSRLSAVHGRPDLLLHFGSRPVLVLSSPSAVEAAFTTHDLAFSNRPYLTSGDIFLYGNTALTGAPYGDTWRQHRRLAGLKLFSASRLSALASLRSVHVHTLLRGLFFSSSSQPQEHSRFTCVGLRDRFEELMLNTIVEMVMGKRYFGESATAEKRFAVLMHEVFRLSGASNYADFLPPFLRWMVPSGATVSMVKVQSELDAYLQEMVEEKRREGEWLHLHGSSEREASKNATLVDTMLSLQKGDPNHYSEDIIKGTIEALVLGGTDTSAASMEWAMSLLLNHPESLQKAYDEIVARVGHDRLVTDSDLPNLPYLKCIIKETLRLFPPGPLLVPRESTTNCKIASFDVPRGTMLLVNAYKMHRDPALWDNAAEFKPERFESGEAKGYKYVPFGAGRRRCPGESMGMRAVGQVLGALIQCFEWRRVGEEAVDITEGEGLSMPKAVPLEAMCRPRASMISILST